MDMLCGDVSCHKDDGKIDDLPALKMKFQDHQIEFSSHEYLYLDEHNVYQLRVGNIKTVQK